MTHGAWAAVRVHALAALFVASACEIVPDVRLGDGPLTLFGADASDVRCGAFGAPTLVAGLASPADDDKPTLPSTMLEIFFFYSKRDGGLGQGDVWRASRASVTDPWGLPALVTAVSSSSRETSPAVSADGTTIWVASDRPGGHGGLDIWVATRSNGSDWSVPIVVPELSSAGDDLPRPPGLMSLVMPLSYRATMPDPYQTYMASRATPSPSAIWTTPVPWTSIDTASLDDDAFLTDDGLTMYFSSDRAGGAQDLFVAERPTTSAPFGAAVPLGSLNTADFNERDPWVSADGHVIYFASDRTGTLKDLFATR